MCLLLILQQRQIGHNRELRTLLRRQHQQLELNNRTCASRSTTARTPSRHWQKAKPASVPFASQFGRHHPDQPQRPDHPCQSGSRQADRPER
jgi:hypothetical protein